MDSSRLLPPATELRQGNVFTPVCHSVHRGGGQTPPGRPIPYVVHAGIRSTSGRYASYWNAILLYKDFDLEPVSKIAFHGH